MNRYRSLETIQAVQYLGEPIPGVTCHGTPEQVQANGCDSSRKQHPHVHTQATGGMTVLKHGDWIFPVQSGPFGVASDLRFRGSWEVPPPAPAPTEATPVDAGVNELLESAGVNATVEQVREEVKILEAAPVMPDVEPVKVPAGEKSDTDFASFGEPVSHVGEAGE